MARRRPRKPRRRFPNVGAVWSGGRWKWRGIVRLNGRQVVGRLRDSQKQAYEDVKGLRERQAPQTRKRGQDLPKRLVEAADAVLEDARSRGLPSKTVAAYDFDLRVVLSYLNPESSVAVIRPQAVEWMIQTALADGYTANTVSTKLLRILRRCFEEAGLEPTPIREARQRLRGMLKIVPPRMPFFTPEELRDLIHRIRNHPFETRYRHGFVTRERDADIVQLIASTGLRSGELSRLRTEDVDLGRKLIFVAKPKVRTRPREAPIPPELEAPLRRLLKAANEHPDQLFVTGSRHTTASVLKRWKKRLNEPRLHARALRHSYATGLLMSGADVATVRDLLGHQTLSAVTTRYAHSASASRREAAERLSRQLVLP